MTILYDEPESISREREIRHEDEDQAIFEENLLQAIQALDEDMVERLLTRSPGNVNIYDAKECNIFLKVAYIRYNDRIIKALEDAGAKDLEDDSEESLEEDSEENSGEESEKQDPGKNLDKDFGKKQKKNIDVAGMLSGVLDCMQKKWQRISELPDAKALSEILEKTKKKHVKFVHIMAFGSPSKDAFLGFIHDISEFNKQFNKKYSIIVKKIEKENNAKKQIDCRIPLCENYLKDLGGMMAAHLKKINKDGESSMKEKTLKKIYGSFLPLANELSRIKRKYSELNEKAILEIENLKKQAAEIAKNFKDIAEKNVELKEVQQDDYTSRIDSAINQAVIILSKVKDSEQEVKSKQGLWLSYQEKINKKSGKEAKEPSSPPSSDQLQIINAEFKPIIKELKELLDFFNITVNFDQEYKIIFEEILKKLNPSSSQSPLLFQKIQEFCKKFKNINEKIQELIKELDLENFSLSSREKKLTPKKIVKNKNKKYKKSSPNNEKNSEIKINSEAKEKVTKLAKKSSSLAQMITADPKLEENLVGLSLAEAKDPDKEKKNEMRPRNQGFFASSFSVKRKSPVLADVVLKQFLLEKIDSVLNFKIEIDQDIKFEVKEESLQKIYIKKNALLMIFCDFYESLKDKEFESIFPGHHLVNKRFFMNVRNYIYHCFPQFMGDLQSSQVQIDHYREVEAMVKMLRQSLAQSNCEPLVESRLFMAYSEISEQDCPKSKSEDLETCRNYFAKIEAIGAESLGMSRDIVMLSNKFMTGVGNIFSENPNHADTAARHSGLLLSFSG